MPTTDLLSRQEMAAFGGKALVRQLQALQEQLSILIRGDDEEAVHQSRVASRRLRACLDVFGPALGATEEWHRETRKITKSLGEARDLDVQIGTLREYMEGGDTSLAPTLQEMQGRRAGLNKKVRKASARFLDSRAARRMANCAEHGEAEPYAEARGHVLLRLQALLDLQSCLEDETQVERHHAMRIAAKQLRYTMEIFRPLYGDEYSELLLTIKSLQEALGEVHDSDVWIAALAEIKEGTAFRMKMQEERKEWFRRAREVWKGAADLSCRLDSLTGFPEGSGGNGTIVLLADVHGNLPALRAVLQDAVREGADRAICAGDMVGFGPYPDECVNVLRAAGVRCIKGNFDEATAGFLLRGVGEFQNHAALATIASMEKSSLEWLDELPTSLRDGDVTVYHSSPWSLREKIEPDSPEAMLDRVVREAGAGIVVLGHTHIQMALAHGGAWIVNPGSVGRQADGDPRARYALLDAEGGVRLRIVSYPEGETAAEADACGLPKALGEAFRRGITYDAAERAMRRRQEDAEKERLAALVAASRAHFIEEHGWDEHADRVRVLSLLLLNAVQDDTLGPHEEALLECAALLHDIGISQGVGGHHKSSMRRIMAADIPFHDEERRMVAVVARYHRAALPRKKHEHYSDMTVEERSIARKLAALLRAADGSDRTGGSGWTAEANEKQVSLHSVTHVSHTLDRDKASLFEKEFGKELRIS